MMSAIGLFTLALLVRLAALNIWRFDGLYGQDAYAYLQQSAAIAERLPAGHPPPADFFWPNGYPFLVAALMGLVGPVALAGRWPACFVGRCWPRWSTS